MGLAVAQRHHLRKKFDIDETARSLLEVDQGGGLGAEFVLDSRAHRCDLVDAVRVKSAAENEFLARRLDFVTEPPVARNHACSHQRLALPQCRTLAMVLVKSGEGRD